MKKIQFHPAFLLIVILVITYTVYCIATFGTPQFDYIH